MPDDARPNPDALLASIQKEAEAAKRGRLKIFFGMCPGVGKTYAMLQAGQQKHAEGVEVVVGLVETHGRKETEALLEGLQIVPRVKIEYRGATLKEMDIDGLLLWHPPLVLVDELAHTNAPGSRHPKRYQDVIELLNAGIDVFTTLNVQHVESRNDLVRQITGVTVRETVPDSIIDLADEMVLVDLTPEQLRTRLAEGKVYLGDRAAVAADSFFRESNLTALRELALRNVAEHVDRDLREMMQTQAQPARWKTSDRLLVAVSASPFSEKLIRYTRQLATTMEAPWIALNIESTRPLTDAEQTRLTRYLTLARQLGAEVVSTPGPDVGEAILRVARQHYVSQIVIGKPLGNPLERWIWRRSPTDWLIRNSAEIDLHMIRSDPGDSAPVVGKSDNKRAIDWRGYGFALATVAVVTVASLVVVSFTGYWAVALFYLLAVVLAATRLTRGQTLILAALSAAVWDFLFIPPKFTFYISEFRDFVMFGTYFVVAIVIGQLTARLREREQSERRREERATSLYRLTRELATSTDLQSGISATVSLIRETFGAESAVLLRDALGVSPHPAGTLVFSQKEISVAEWAFKQKQAAGHFTDTLPDAEALHLPLLASGRAEGVLAVKFPGAMAMEQRELLEAVAAQLALFLEKEYALEASRSAHLAEQSQKLQKTLFDSVSHELKTPLAAMSAALDQPQPDRAELRQAVRRLTNTVSHLLDATRLESGLLQLSREWCDAAELLREAIDLARIEGREIKTSEASELPLVFVDPGLFEQALVTLISNAVIYSTADSPIEARVVKDDNTIVFQIADRGPGLGAGEEVRVFEKFYRGEKSPTGGLGLGLAIARQLVEAHGGTIVARNREGGGACFSIRLPLGEPIQLPVE